MTSYPKECGERRRGARAGFRISKGSINNKSFTHFRNRSKQRLTKGKVS